MSLSLSSTRSFDNSFSAFERSAYLVKHSYGVGVEVKTHVKYYLLEVDFHEAVALAHGKVRDFSIDKHLCSWGFVIPANTNVTDVMDVPNEINGLNARA